MRAASLRFGLFATTSAVAASLWAAACGGKAPDPGFENLGGDAAVGATTAASQASATHGSPASNATSASATHSAASTQVAASSSTGQGCGDTGPEPNETEQTAIDLGGIGDCDGDGESFSGMIDGNFDVDWYKFHGSDASMFCSVDPSRTLTSSAPVRLCKFIQCDNAESNNFDCPGGTTAASSPDGRPGCCSSGNINFDLVCGGSQFNDDNAVVFIRIDNPDESMCPTYTVDYHY